MPLRMETHKKLYIHPLTAPEKFRNFVRFTWSGPGSSYPWVKILHGGYLEKNISNKT